MSDKKNGIKIIIISSAAIMTALFLSLSAQNTPDFNELSVKLTAEEKEWIESHGEITVALDPSWPPFEFLGPDGNLKGITPDYLDILEKRTGLKFRPITGLMWNSAYEKLKKHEIDMTTSVMETSDRKKFWSFTKPYINIPIMIFTRSDAPYISDMKELYGKRVAVVDGYATAELISEDYPGIITVKSSDTPHALSLLRDKSVYAYIDNMLVADYFITTLGFSGLKISGNSGYINSLSMAARNDWPILLSILQKGLDTISEKERSSIYYKWVTVEYRKSFNYSLLVKGIGAAVILILFLIFWIMRLRAEISARKKAEGALSISEYELRSHFLNTPAGVIKWNTDFTVAGWNPAAADIFGYTEDEALGRSGDFIIPESFKSHMSETWSRILNETSPVYSTNENIRKDGSVVICEWINTPVCGIDGKIISIISLFTDKTKQIQSEEQIRSSLAEKETLLRELYHRTKNNMQVISSFLQLQARHLNNPKTDSLASSVISRIKTMSLVHEKLYQSKNLSRINLKDYIEELVPLITNYYSVVPGRISIEMNIENINLVIESAIPLGLIINETVTNSFKHAFPGGRNGKISITVREETDSCIRIIISDNGIGLPESINPRDPSFFGLMTTAAIIEHQMQGTFEITSSGGLTYNILIKNRKHPPAG